MSTTTIALQPNDSIENFIALVRQASACFSEAAPMLARLCQHDPDTLTKVIQAAPTVPHGFLLNLLRVGEGSLHQGLLLNNTPAYRRLRMLPYTVQTQALSAGAVEVVLNAETGQALRIPLTELKPEQVNQVLGREGIRSADEQRAILRRKQISEAKPVPRAEAFPWIVKHEKVLITKSVELTRKDIMRILEEMAA
jgi:hypothetical protein